MLSGVLPKGKAAMSEETRIVLTTCGNDEDAAELAKLLVGQRLAACVNAVSRVASTYRWKGEVLEDRETLLIIKTTARRLAALENAIRAHSKYELPEIIALSVEAGSAKYLAWVGESVAELKD
jgi:periplasmic divalent cation tolerance protein